MSTSNIVKRTPSTTPEQLAFDIFDALRKEIGPNTDITKSPREIGYRKGTVLLSVTALSVLQRRVVNAAWLLAAQNPKLESYDVDLAYFKWLARYDNSENYAHLRKVLNECQKATVQVTVEDDNPAKVKWVSVQLLGRVAMAGGRISFKVDELIRRELENPKGFTFLSVRIGAALSQYAYAFYERLGALRYQGTTEWFSVEEIRSWANADAYPSLAEYKQFKRYVIEKAVTQINELTDIRVTYEVRTTPGSRKVAYIRFIIRDNPNGALVLEATRPHELKDLYDILVNDFGLSQDEIQELVDNRDQYSDERIHAAIEFTRHRAKQGKIKLPARYLMKAIREQLKLGTIEKENAQGRAGAPDDVPPRAAAAQAAQNSVVSKGVEEGIVAYLKLDEEARADLRSDLARAVTFKAALKRTNVKAPDEQALLSDAVLRVELGTFAYYRLNKPAAAKSVGSKSRRSAATKD
jgi:hypothetical protein